MRNTKLTQEKCLARLKRGELFGLAVVSGYGLGVVYLLGTMVLELLHH